MATLKELSQMTGYSITTISRVLNEDETLNVTDATREMILKTAGKMDYVSKHAANKKNTQVHLTLAIVEMDDQKWITKDSYYMYMKSNVEQCCFDKGIETVLMQYDQETNSYRTAIKKEIDGIIAIGQFNSGQIADMEMHSKNLIFLDAAPKLEEYSSVVPNFEVGINQGIRYLRRCGHKKIAFVGPKYSTDATRRQAPELRRNYFRDYFLREKDKEALGIFIDIEWHDQNVTERIIRYLKSHQDESMRPTAFFAYNENTAMGVMRALQMLGYNVPQDFSVLSYNDTALATLVQPALSSVRICMEEMATIAVEQLERLIEKSGCQTPVRISVPSQLIIRESVRDITE